LHCLLLEYAQPGYLRSSGNAKPVKSSEKQINVVKYEESMLCYANMLDDLLVIKGVFAYLGLFYSSYFQERIDTDD